MDTPYRTIDVKPLSGALGAEIDGVDIASGLNEEQFAEILSGLLRIYSVILFRNQSPHAGATHRICPTLGGYQCQPIFCGRSGKSHYRRGAKRTRSGDQYRSQLAYRSFL